MKKIRQIFKMIAEGVNYIHSMGLVHFDLKFDNILINVDTDGNITDLRISDFGLTRSNKEFKTNVDSDGTLVYMAPEMFVKDSFFNEKIDIWSLGVILFSLLNYEMPFVC